MTTSFTPQAETSDGPNSAQEPHVVTIRSSNPRVAGLALIGVAAAAVFLPIFEFRTYYGDSESVNLVKFAEGFEEAFPGMTAKVYGAVAVAAVALVFGLRMLFKGVSLTTTSVTTTVPTPAAWADDPFGRHQKRYWNGATWTAHVSNAGVQSDDRPGHR